MYFKVNEVINMFTVTSLVIMKVFYFLFFDEDHAHFHMRSIVTRLEQTGACSQMYTTLIIMQACSIYSTHAESLQTIQNPAFVY